MDLTRYCLDTSAYSQFRRGQPEAVEHISKARWLGVPAVVLGELRHGFLRGTRSEANERRLQEFLAHPFVEVLDVDDEASQIYAALTVELRKTGRPIPTNDAWIAALAVREGARLLTYDAHFAPLPGVASLLLEL